MKCEACGLESADPQAFSGTVKILDGVVRCRGCEGFPPVNDRRELPTGERTRVQGSLLPDEAAKRGEFAADGHPQEPTP